MIEQVSFRTMARLLFGIALLLAAHDVWQMWQHTHDFNQGIPFFLAVALAAAGLGLSSMDRWLNERDKCLVALEQKARVRTVTSQRCRVVPTCLRGHEPHIHTELFGESPVGPAVVELDTTVGETDGETDRAA